MEKHVSYKTQGVCSRGIEFDDIYFIYDEGCGIYACKESGSTHEIYTLSKMYHHELLSYNQIKSIYRQYSRYIKNN